MAADDEDRDAIILRRRRFVAAALSGIAVTTGTACGDSHEPTADAGPGVCLGAPFDAGPSDAGRPDAGPPPMPCLEPPEPDAGAASDAGAELDAGPRIDAGRGVDAGEPKPCLSPPAPPEDAGSDAEPEPMPCLTF